MQRRNFLKLGSLFGLAASAKASIPVTVTPISYKPVVKATPVTIEDSYSPPKVGPVELFQFTLPDGHVVNMRVPTLVYSDGKSSPHIPMTMRYSIYASYNLTTGKELKNKAFDTPYKVVDAPLVTFDDLVELGYMTVRNAESKVDALRYTWTFCYPNG